MIARLSGKIISKSSTEAVVDCGGVGYLVFVPVTTSEKLPQTGGDCSLHTVLIHREDSMALYGFSSELEKNAFQMLISISGVGAKIALGILSSISISDLQEHILSGNSYALTKLPGIGKKSAERLIVELKDKIVKLTGAAQTETGTGNLVAREAAAALLTLGYSKAQAEKAVRKAAASMSPEEQSAENLIKTALKFAVK